MFNTKTEILNLCLPNGTVKIKRSKLKAVIVETTFTMGYHCKSTTVIRRNNEQCHHFAFGNIEQLKDYYGYSLLHEN